MAFEPDLLEAAHALVVSLPPHGQVLFPGHSPPTHPHPPTTTPPSHSAEVHTSQGLIRAQDLRAQDPPRGRPRQPRGRPRHGLVWQPSWLSV